MEGAHQIHHYLIESIEDEKGQQRLQVSWFLCRM